MILQIHVAFMIIGATATLPILAYSQDLPKFVSPFERGSDIQPLTGEDRAPAVPLGDYFNWTVSVGHKGRNHALGGHFCGGSVIGKRWVLTAAHCVTKATSEGSFQAVEENQIQIKTGAELPTTTSHFYYVEEIFIHPDFAVTVHDSLVNDVALLKTTEDLITNLVPMVQPVNASNVGGELVVLGWGKPGAQTNYLSQRLRYLRLQSIENDVCFRDYYPGLIDDKMICALGYGTDACQGDSGGPLVAFDANSTPFLLGVVSWGDQCGEQLKPGIYASVPAYYRWITETVRGAG